MKTITGYSVILFVLVKFSSCSSGTADKKVPEIAGEMCSCFDKFKNTVTKDEMQVLKTVSLADKPQQELIDAFGKMETAEATAFANKIKSVGDKGSDVFKCIEGFDKKHAKETTKDKTALTEKLLAELQSKNCTIGAAMVNLSLGRGKK